MEVSVRELKNRLSEYLRKLSAGAEIIVTAHGKPVARLLPPPSRKSKRSSEEEAIMFLRSQSWIRAGSARKPRVPSIVVSLKVGEMTLAEIVAEQRG